jgi:serine/threonine-protein phosphatase 2A regulatory subunit A
MSSSGGPVSTMTMPTTTTTTSSPGSVAGGSATGGTTTTGGLTTLSRLPLPSIQMARGLVNLSVSGNSTPSVGDTTDTGTSNTTIPTNTIPIESMTAFELFKVQIESGSTEASIDAMKRLGVVSQAVGPNETSNHIVPYLTNLVLQQSSSSQSATTPPSSSSTTTTTTPAVTTTTAADGTTTTTTTTPATTTTTSTTTEATAATTTSNNNNLANVLLSDELLLLLGQQILEVNDVIPNQQEIFLPLLERLAAVEETVVRDQAVIALTVLCTQKASIVITDGGSNNNPDIIAPWLALVKRLASADWFTAKVSSCGIVAPIFALVNATAPHTIKLTEQAAINAVAIANAEGTSTATDGSTTTTTTDEAVLTADSPSPATPQQVQCYELLLSTYKDLCLDETPMVRRAAAKYFGQVLKQAGWYHGREFGSALLGPVLCRDEQDSVRLLAVSSLKDVGPIFGQMNPSWTIKYWLPTIKDGSTDMSWRVRNNLAKCFSDVVQTLGIQYSTTNTNHNKLYHTEQSLVMSCFVALITDPEADVRAAAVTHLARMVSWGGQSHYITHIQPLLPSLADDVVVDVRSKCALALMDAAHGGTLDNTIILQNFGPLLESFLQDEYHEVQLQVLCNLHKIASLLPGLSGVVSTLLQMPKATNWRVREAVAKLLPHLAEARGLDFFTSVLLEPAYLTLLLDPVANVREAIVAGMTLLVKVAGQDWMVNTILPHHITIYNTNGLNSYLIRTTILHSHIQCAIQCCILNGGGPLLTDVLLQIVQRGLSDKVPNVRMVSAKGLVKIFQAMLGQSTTSSSSSSSIEGEGEETKSSTQHPTALDEETVSLLHGQVKPILDTLINDEIDPDVRLATQDAYDYFNEVFK